MNSGLHAFRIGERNHRVRELQIIAAECSALDCERLRERSFRSPSVVVDLMMEDAEPIKPVRERKIILFQDHTRLREELIRIRSVVFDGIVIETQVLQRYRISRMLVSQRMSRHVTGPL